MSEAGPYRVMSELCETAGPDCVVGPGVTFSYVAPGSAKRFADSLNIAYAAGAARLAEVEGKLDRLRAAARNLIADGTPREPTGYWTVKSTDVLELSEAYARSFDERGAEATKGEDGK